MAAEGVGGLYKGISAPLAAVAAFNAVLFAANGIMKDTVSKISNKSPEQFGVLDYTLCGAGAGVFVSFVATPSELVKCRLQASADFAGY